MHLSIVSETIPIAPQILSSPAHSNAEPRTEIVTLRRIALDHPPLVQAIPTFPPAWHAALRLAPAMLRSSVPETPASVQKMKLLPRVFRVGIEMFQAQLWLRVVSNFHLTAKKRQELTV